MKLKIYNKTYEFLDNCPKCVIDLFYSKVKVIPFEFYKKYRKFFPATKRFKLNGRCENCHRIIEVYINSIEKRTLKSIIGKLLCHKCVPKLVGADPRWKKKNSETQKIIQNKPEVKAKNARSVSLARKDPERIKNWGSGIIKEKFKKSERYQNRDEQVYKEELLKIVNMNDYYEQSIQEYEYESFNKFKKCFRGEFFSKINGNIRFDSSFELRYLIYCDLKMIKTKRFKGFVHYFLNDEKRRYFPDFLQNENTVVEVKSFTQVNYCNSNEEIKNKKKAILQYCKKKGFKFKMFKENNLPLFCNRSYHTLCLIHVFLKNNSIRLYDEHKNLEIVSLNTKAYKKTEKMYTKWNNIKHIGV